MVHIEIFFLIQYCTIKFISYDLGWSSIMFCNLFILSLTFNADASFENSTLFGFRYFWKRYKKTTRYVVEDLQRWEETETTS